MSETRKFRVEGRVQGVWFRESTRRKAEPLGISGYARNLPDGSVEVLAGGTVEALDKLERWLSKGPPLAKVKSLRGEIVAEPPGQGFRTL